MEFNKFKLKELLQVNPRMTLKKGSKAKKIAMENIKEFQKKIDNFTIEEFKSGSKFQNGDTLLARITPCLENGKTAYIRADSYCSRHLAFCISASYRH